jgi:hypothetical protein
LPRPEAFHCCFEPLCRHDLKHISNVIFEKWRSSRDESQHATYRYFEKWRIVGQITAEAHWWCLSQKCHISAQYSRGNVLLLAVSWSRLSTQLRHATMVMKRDLSLEHGKTRFLMTKFLQSWIRPRRSIPPKRANQAWPGLS